jgi:hypothetical protein
MEARGAELLAETPGRITLEVTLPKFDVPLGGLSRLQWEACRLVMCNVVPPTNPRS